MSDDLSIPNSGYRSTQAGRYGTGRSRLRQGMDPATRRLVMFAGGLGAVLVTLIAISTLTGRHSGEVPVVSADNHPIREKPANPGGMKIDAAENDVFSAGTDTSDAKLAPPAEKPITQALRTPPAQPQPEAAPPPVQPAAPAAAEPPPAPVPAPVTRPAVVAIVPPAPKPVPMKPPAAAAEARPPAVAHQAMVQLAALATEDAARAEWTQLTKKMPDLLTGRQPTYQRVERNGHTFWRVRTAGFADLAQARGFCERVRAKGAGCSVADF